MAYLQKRRVGETELKISRVGLGGGPLANLYESVSENQAISTVKKALDVGFSHFDTAPLYGFGLSETRIGKVLENVARDKFTISTKVGRILTPLQKGGDRYQYVDVPNLEATFDFSAKGIMKSFESSIGRLGVDKFDMLLLHDCDNFIDQAIKESYPVLARLKKEGLVKAIGAGLNSYKTAMALADRAQFDCFLVAGRYTILEQGALDRFLPYCKDNNVGVIIGGPFNSGILASNVSEKSKYGYAKAPSGILGKARKIEAICNKYGVSLRAAALQFVLANPIITSVIPGCKSPKEVEDCYSALNENIPIELWQELKREGRIKEEAPVPS